MTIVGSACNATTENMFNENLIKMWYGCLQINAQSSGGFDSVRLGEASL